MLTLQSNFSASPLNPTVQSVRHSGCSIDKRVVSNTPVNNLIAQGNSREKDYALRNKIGFIKNIKRANNTHVALSGCAKKSAKNSWANSSLFAEKFPHLLETVSNGKINTQFSDLPVEIVRHIFKSGFDDSERWNNINNAFKAGLLDKRELTDVISKIDAEKAFEDLKFDKNYILEMIENTDWETLLLIKDLPNFKSISIGVDNIKVIQQGAYFYKSENIGKDLYSLLQQVIESSNLGSEPLNELLCFFLKDDKSSHIILKYMDENNIELEPQTMLAMMSPYYIYSPVVQQKLISAPETAISMGMEHLKKYVYLLGCNEKEREKVDKKGIYNDTYLRTVKSILNKREHAPKGLLDSYKAPKNKTLNHLVNFRFNEPQKSKILEMLR